MAGASCSMGVGITCFCLDSSVDVLACQFGLRFITQEPASASAVRDSEKAIRC